MTLNPYKCFCIKDLKNLKTYGVGHNYFKVNCLYVCAGDQLSTSLD